MKTISIYLLLLIYCSALNAQKTINFDGQLSGIANISPKSQTWGLLNARYIPELNYSLKLDTTHSLYFETSANIWSSVYFHENDSVSSSSDTKAYRVYSRFSGNNYEIRIGLQKIDFGSASILRPLQWFNEIDPRDPLAITEGVNSILGRYYFKNNANLWLWGLIANEDPRGYDFVGSNASKPEIGGRFQHPIPKGEVALSYNHRSADGTQLIDSSYFEDIGENRYGIDGKWDLGVGLWVEGSYIKKNKDLGRSREVCTSKGGIILEKRSTIETNNFE